MDGGDLIRPIQIEGIDVDMDADASLVEQCADRAVPRQDLIPDALDEQITSRACQSSLPME